MVYIKSFYRNVFLLISCQDELSGLLLLEERHFLHLNVEFFYFLALPVLYSKLFRDNQSV